MKLLNKLLPLVLIIVLIMPSVYAKVNIENVSAQSQVSPTPTYGVVGSFNFPSRSQVNQMFYDPQNHEIYAIFSGAISGVSAGIYVLSASTNAILDTIAIQNPFDMTFDSTDGIMFVGDNIGGAGCCNAGGYVVGISTTTNEVVSNVSLSTATPYGSDGGDVASMVYDLKTDSVYIADNAQDVLLLNPKTDSLTTVVYDNWCACFTGTANSLIYDKASNQIFFDLCCEGEAFLLVIGAISDSTNAVQWS